MAWVRVSHHWIISLHNILNVKRYWCFQIRIFIENGENIILSAHIRNIIYKTIGQNQASRREENDKI